MTTSALVAGYLCGFVLVCMYMWIAIALHMAYTKMDTMLEHLKNSSSVMALAPLKHGGPWGRLLLIGGISGFLTFPKLYARRGGVSPEDLKKFPEPLKRQLTMLYWSVMILIISLVLSVTSYKLIKAYHL